MKERPNIKEWAMLLAIVTSLRATCTRRKVGCVLLDVNGHVLSTGYNGVAAGEEHCITTHCPGAHCKTGEGLDLCEAIHAEQNALLRCQDVTKIDKAFITVAPCITCTKLLLNTSCQEIIFGECYIKTEGQKLWIRAKKSWTYLPKEIVQADWRI